LERSDAQVDNAARGLARIGSDSAAGAGGIDTVELSQEAVGLLSAKDQFGANIDVLKIVDDMQKSAIQLLAGSSSIIH
jgi:hypothetical protein